MGTNTVKELTLLMMNIATVAVTVKWPSFRRNPVNRRERVNDYSTRGREGSSRYESNHAEEGIMNHQAAVRNNYGSNFDSHRGRPTEISSVNRSNYGFFNQGNRLGHQNEYSNGGRERISRYESRNNAHRSDGQSGSQRHSTRSESFDAMVLKAYHDFALNRGPRPIPPSSLLLGKNG
ncbi:unnamed protein product [Caenorhabditis nigoni]